MGKKSKRKNNKQSPCYHGCTKKEFNAGKYYKILEGCDNKMCDNAFYETHKRVMSNPIFGCFVIAHVTEDFLKGKDDDLLYYRLLLLFAIRYIYIPHDEGKDVGPESENFKNYSKYCRDIVTTSKRGRINCIAREIPCDCMKEKKIEAKSMEKVAGCWCCEQQFSKEKMLRCKGCNHAQYCSKECSIKAWPIHKKNCKKHGAPTPTPGCLQSFGETSDVDAEE